MRHPRATSIALICVLGTWAACPREQAYVISRVQLCVTLWPVARQFPLSRRFSRQEYWRGLPFPTPRDLPNPGIEPHLLLWQVDSIPLCHLGSQLAAQSWANSLILSRHSFLICNMGIHNLCLTKLLSDRENNHILAPATRRRTSKLGFPFLGEVN